MNEMKSKLDRIAFWMAVVPPFVTGSMFSLLLLGMVIQNAGILDFGLDTENAFSATVIAFYCAYGTLFCWSFSLILKVFSEGYKQLLNRFASRNDNKKI